MRFFQIMLWVIGAGSVIASAQPAKNWAISTSVGNSVGIGTFVADYSQVPAWTTSLSLAATYKFELFNLSAFQLMSFWWLDSYRTGASDYQDRFSLMDTNITASMPKILNYDGPGIALGSGATVLLPASRFSRNINRIIGLGLNMPVSWSKWGFSAGYTPSVQTWIYSDSNISVPCYEMPPATINPYDTNANIDQAIQGLSIIRNADERLGDGRCLVAGRQNTWSVNNSISLGWSNPNHAVSMSMMWLINFLRPLADKPDLRSDYAINQNFNEATMGRIAYSYTVPIETNLVFSAGVMSWQSSRDREGRLTFPFFDFVTPGNNQTQIFVQATVGI